MCSLLVYKVVRGTACNPRRKAQDEPHTVKVQAFLGCTSTRDYSSLLPRHITVHSTNHALIHQMLPALELSQVTGHWPFSIHHQATDFLVTEESSSKYSAPSLQRLCRSGQPCTVRCFRCGINLRRPGGNSSILGQLEIHSS